MTIGLSTPEGIIIFLPSAPSMKIICLDHVAFELLQVHQSIKIVHQQSMYILSPNVLKGYTLLETLLANAEA